MTPVHALSINRLAIHIFASREDMGRAAGQAAANEIQRVLAAQGHARIILASAPSQNELLDALTSAPIDWTRVTLFHMDEYVGLDATHPATFRHYQRTHVLSRVQPACFHGILGESPDPAAECARYAALLAAAPIDVVCLGIGENGHIAFNDPPVADFADPELIKIVELDPICRQQQVNDGCFPSLDAVPRHALTLTVPALMNGRALFCAVPGPRKANAVRDTLLGPISPACPASILRTHPNTTLYLDRDSAALLPAT
jgi:glucosamine-6-phosphate deaminase